MSITVISNLNFNSSTETAEHVQRGVTISNPFSLDAGTHNIHVTAGFSPSGTVSLEEQYKEPLQGRAGEFVNKYRSVGAAAEFAEKNSHAQISLPTGVYRFSADGANAKQVSVTRVSS